jgi:streptomycin 6-kinase
LDTGDCFASLAMTDMNLPSIFTANIIHAFGERGKSFLAELPQLIGIASKQWGLMDVTPVSDLSYNFVAFAKCSSTSLPGGRSAQRDVVLKIGVPDKELISEIAALKYFNGDGAVKLLEHDPSHSMFLLERLRPGKMLVTLEEDDECTEIAADLMLKLWRPLQEIAPVLQNQFTKLTDWFNGLKGLRPMFNGGTGPFPQKLIEHFEETLPRLYAESSPLRLIHGDFHHFNILSSERGWIAIDPKGVIGHPEYEVGPLMINPWPGFLNGSNPRVQTERRLDILSERLGYPRERLKGWALCHAVLSSWWDMHPDGAGGEYSLQCAELFASI